MGSMRIPTHEKVERLRERYPVCKANRRRQSNGGMGGRFGTISVPMGLRKFAFVNSRRGRFQKTDRGRIKRGAK